MRLGLVLFCLQLNASTWDLKQLMGAANEFKDGDVAVKVAARNQKQREKARLALAQISLETIHTRPLYQDKQQALIWNTTDNQVYEQIKTWTLGDLKNFLLTHSEAEIKKIMPGLNSDVIAGVIKLMNNQELIHIGQTIFNPLPHSHVGSKGYMGARIQPNSPTDNPQEIAWQVFNGFSYAVGDVLLGNNPVDSTPESVAQVESTLKDIIFTFGLEAMLPWSVLAHIDIQDQVERQNPGSTELYFQSIGGVEDANQTFGVSTQKLINYAEKRKNHPHGFYFETGQGADFTNGHGHGFDMVVHESRKYGLVRAIKQKNPWIIVNDVAGFIGPEVFKTKEQLVRVCLEDIAMGKLHGLTIGLDICSTLHMSISLDDLQWCQDQIMPANPAYLMALPTRNDPMLSYLTTSFRDHVRIREKFGFRINDDLWEFFKKILVIDVNGKPTEHFGDPIWVYYQYRLRKGDQRPFQEIYEEGEKIVAKIATQGIYLDVKNDPLLENKIRSLYNDAKQSLWLELSPQFIQKIPNRILLKTNAKNRSDYIAHPTQGEKLSPSSIKKLRTIKNQNFEIQIVISDGLNARSIMETGHLMPYLNTLRKTLAQEGFKTSTLHLLIEGGRVRVGYQIGEILFSKQTPSDRPKTLIHIIGERPGNGHNTFSAYITSANTASWGTSGKVDHDITQLVSGISNTSLKPEQAALETVRLLKKSYPPNV